MTIREETAEIIIIIITSRSQPLRCAAKSHRRRTLRGSPSEPSALGGKKSKAPPPQKSNVPLPPAETAQRQTASTAYPQSSGAAPRPFVRTAACVGESSDETRFPRLQRISGEAIPYQNHSLRAPARFPHSARAEQRFPFSDIALATSAAFGSLRRANDAAPRLHSACTLAAPTARPPPRF